MVTQFYSIYNEPMLTMGLDLIKHGAANIYAREIFKEIRKEIQGVASLLVSKCEKTGATIKYILTKFCIVVFSTRCCMTRVLRNYIASVLYGIPMHPMQSYILYDET